MQPVRLQNLGRHRRGRADPPPHPAGCQGARPLSGQRHRPVPRLSLIHISVQLMGLMAQLKQRRARQAQPVPAAALAFADLPDDAIIEL